MVALVVSVVAIGCTPAPSAEAPTAHGPTTTEATDGRREVCGQAPVPGAGGSGDASAPPSSGCRPSAEGSAGRGYEVLRPTLASRPEVTVRVQVAAAAVYFDLRRALERLSAITGNTWTMGGLTLGVRPAAPGEVVVIVGTLCGGLEAGCAVTAWERGLLSSAAVSIAPSTLGTWYQYDVVLHELGHVAGLGHFDDEYHGSVQAMRSRVTGWLNAYQEGDVNGLVDLAARGRAVAANGATAAVAPAAATLVVQE